MSLRSLRRGSTYAAAVVMIALPLAACGSDDESASTTTKKPTTTEEESTTTEADSDDGDAGVAEVREVLEEGNDLELSSDELDCAAEALTEELGAEAAIEAAQPDQPVAEEYLEQTAAVFEDCVSAESYARGMVGILAGDGEVSDDFTTCLTGELEGNVSQVFIEGNQEGTPETLAAAFETCATPEDTAVMLTGAFVASGLDQATAECVSAAVSEQYGMSDLLADSEELNAAVNEAMTTCGASDPPVGAEPGA